MSISNTNRSGLGLCSLQYIICSLQYIISRSSRAECLAHLGARFRILLDLPDRVSDIEAGEVLLERYIMVHLKNNEEKFVLLMEMISKLYKLANDEISPDNPDSLNNHVWID